MIDSIALAWGHAIGSEPRRADAPGRRAETGVKGSRWTVESGRRAEPKAAPIRLDLEELAGRLGSDEGQVRSIRYKHGEFAAGHWHVGDVDVLYREGRVELRASLPKLLTGRNDTVLDERGVHVALRELTAAGAELIRHPLELREADPVRIDYAFQWDVPSVVHVLEHVKAALPLDRKLRTEHVSPKGGRSLVWGYGTKRVLRFYDKVGELAVHGEESNSELDTLLRYEVQDRRRPKLRLVHEQGYTAAAARRELTFGIHRLGAVADRGREAFIRARQLEWPQHGFAYALAALHLADNEEMEPVVRKLISKTTWYRWQARKREAALAVADWLPHIPDNAFTGATSLWEEGSVELAA